MADKILAELMAHLTKLDDDAELLSGPSEALGGQEYWRVVERKEANDQRIDDEIKALMANNGFTVDEINKYYVLRSYRDDPCGDRTHLISREMAEAYIEAGAGSDF